MVNDKGDTSRKYDLFLLISILSTMTIIGVILTGLQYISFEPDEPGQSTQDLIAINWKTNIIIKGAFGGVSVLICLGVFINFCCRCLSFPAKIVLLVVIVFLMFSNAVMLAILLSEQQTLIDYLEDNFERQYIQSLIRYQQLKKFNNWTLIATIVNSVGSFGFSMTVLIMNIVNQETYHQQNEQQPRISEDRIQNQQQDQKQNKKSSEQENNNSQTQKNIEKDQM